MNLVELKGIDKDFDDVKALQNVNIKLEKGKVYGLIGRNGAGKTTLLKIVSDMIFPTKGEKVKDDKWLEATTDVAFARDYNLLYGSYRLRDILGFAAGIYPRYDVELEKKLVKAFGLDVKKQYQRASKGMQNMVSLIVALCSDAKLLLLDEPYSGLDPVNRELFYKVLREKYFNEEKTVVISSHLIKEIEGYFEEAVIIDGGQILIAESLDDIYDKSFTIEGGQAVYNWLKTHKQPIADEKLMNSYKVYLHETMTKDELAKIEDLGGTVDGMDLQTLMIKLVAGEEVIL